jgi:hypothetical protein
VKKNMSKPIFIVRFPYEEENRSRYLETCKHLGEQLSDYHVLCPMDSSISIVEFECYNATNATEKDIEEIKQIVLKQLKDEQTR